jgi:hypothetical protein
MNTKKWADLIADATKGNRTLRCTDRAYDELLARYGTDKAVFAAVSALMNMGYANAEKALLGLCLAHRINALR